MGCSPQAGQRIRFEDEDTRFLFGHISAGVLYRGENGGQKQTGGTHYAAREGQDLGSIKGDEVGDAKPQVMGCAVDGSLGGRVTGEGCLAKLAACSARLVG